MAWLLVALSALRASAQPETALAGAFHAHATDFFSKTVPEGNRESGNDVLILDKGYEALLARVHLIRSARESIDIQTFIWHNDATARVVLHELVQAAHRGVQVRVIADQLGSDTDPVRLAKIFAASPNIQIKLYRPIGGMAEAYVPLAAIDFLLPSGTNQRMHVKAFIVDGFAGIVGGRNVEDKYYDYSLTYNFKDRDALVLGPAVADMTDKFNDYWSAHESVSSNELVDVAWQISNGLEPFALEHDDVYNGAFLQRLDEQASDPAVIRERLLSAIDRADRLTYVCDAPGKKKEFFYWAEGHSGETTEAMMNLFAEAQDTILMQTPYVIVNSRTSRAFKRLYKQRPDLRIMISTNSLGAADHLITYAANYRLRSRVVLEHGMEVYEYKPFPEDLPVFLPNADELAAMGEEVGKQVAPHLSIHAKTYVIDDRLAFVGSYNLDPRSFYLNSENGIIIEDDELAVKLKEDLLRDMSSHNSWTIAKRDRPYFGLNRLMEGLSSRSPVDFWPVRSTSGYELIPGKVPVSPEDPAFFDNYMEIGKYPGTYGPSVQRVTVQLMKLLGKPVTPLL